MGAGSAREATMVIGQTLMKLAGSAYYSPPFGRRGLAATFVCQVLQVGGTSPTLDIDVEHKNAEDTTYATAGSFTQLTAAGIGTVNVADLKEEVRFKYVVGGGSATAAIHFNMLAPAWRPYVS